MKLIIENQKLLIAEILGMKSRIETLERQDINKNVAIDIVVESLLHQKRIIQQKLNQVDESLFYLNCKLASRNYEIVKPKEAADKKIIQDLTEQDSAENVKNAHIFMALKCVRNSWTLVFV
jgi:cob(I)alamin adenosyltransferase